MELATYQLLYKTLSTIKTILVITFIGLFLYNSYVLYMNNSSVILDYLKFSSKTTSSNGVISYALQELNLLKHLVIMLACLYIAHFIYARFPVSSKKILQWDNNNEIDTILGRFISSHFRYNKSLDTRGIAYFYSLAQFERSMLGYHINNTHLDTFIKKYDNDFIKDIS